MTDISAEAAKAAAQATAGSEAKKPQPLSAGERFAATILFLSGLAVIGLTMYAFSTTDSHFVFKSKQKTVTESTPSAGTTPAAAPTAALKKAERSKRRKCAKKKNKKQRKRCIKKSHSHKKVIPKTKATPALTTREIDYSESVAIFALTVGVALALCGGFYGRLRSLKLGALELGFVDPKAATAASEQAVEQIEQKNFANADKEEAAKAAVAPVAVADLRTAVALGVQPTDQIISSIADQAATKVAAAIE